MPQSNKNERTAALVASPSGAEGLIRKREVARRLDVDVRTIDNYMRRGWIPYYKVGKLVYFYWPEVVEAVLGKG